MRLRVPGGGVNGPALPSGFMSGPIGLYAHKPMVYVASGRVDDKELLEQIKNDFVAENATRCLIKHGDKQ